MNPLLIVNPSAGGGRAGRTFAALRPVVERVLGSVDAQITTSSGHAIVLARAAAEEGRELVIALGGDGTLHEVANGVLNARSRNGSEPGRTAVAFVAQGTGGDFRKSLGVSHRLDECLEAIASGRERRVDAARATFRNGDGEGKRWFVNILSAGLGGLVDRFVTEAPRALTPTAAYLWASLRAVAGTDQAPMSLVVERAGERTERRLSAWAIAVCNGTTFGSGMRVAPMAAVDDGRLEIVALSAPSKLAFLALARNLYGGTHVGRPGVLHLSGERVEIASAGGPGAAPVLLDIDGEPLGALPVTIEIVPGVLRFRA